MRKAKKTPPPIVQFARTIGDRAALSRLGRAGAMRKKEFAAKDRKRKERLMLASASQMARQANEHICPID